MIGLCKSEVVKVWRADEGMRCVSVYMCAVITVGVGHVLLSVKRPDPSTSPPTLTLARSEGRESGRPITNTRLVFLTPTRTRTNSAIIYIYIDPLIMGSSQLQCTILPSSMMDMGVNLFIRQGSVSMSGGASPLHISS